MKKMIAIFLLNAVLTGCHENKETSLDLEATPAKAELFGEGVISTRLYERDLAISPNGDEIVFTLSDYRQTRRCLVMISKSGTKWGPKKIMPFTGQYSDIEPFFSTDGNSLFFASDRPLHQEGQRSDYNIWVAERISSGWSEPKPLPLNINSENDEFYPSVGRTGNLYFTAKRTNGIGGEDIFMSMYSDGRYHDPEPLDSAINTPGDEFNAFIHPDEGLIVFGAYGRAGGQGGVDLYYSTKDSEGNWTSSKNMGPEVNSSKLDFCPFIDAPRGNFYFSSDRMANVKEKIENVEELEMISNGTLNGMGNIFRIRLEGLIRDK